MSAWKQRAVEGMKNVFSKGAKRSRGDHEGESRDLRAKIGELTVERIDELFLKYPFQSELVRQSREGEGIGRARAD